MSEESSTRRTRRRLLKAVGATGLALGVAGTAAADTDETVEDGATTEGYWEYQCTRILCDSGPGCVEQKRYCANDDCSGWEVSGCCAC